MGNAELGEYTVSTLNRDKCFAMGIEEDAEDNAEDAEKQGDNFYRERWNRGLAERE